VADLLRVADVSRRTCTMETLGAGAFDDLRLLAGEALERETPRLLEAIAHDILDHPPHELRWLEACEAAGRMLILRFITDPAMSLSQLQLEWGGDISDEKRADLLALRGLLACGLTVHCLCRRHRVDYVVDARRGKSLRVAVPFRASDTPADRAEYAQPDILIVLTLLSYYHSAISRDEMREAVVALLTLGPEAQKAEYTLWLDSATPTLPAEERAAVDSVDKLDTSNDELLDRLHTAYQHNMAAVRRSRPSVEVTPTRNYHPFLRLPSSLVSPLSALSMREPSAPRTSFLTPSPPIPPRSTSGSTRASCGERRCSSPPVWWPTPSTSPRAAPSSASPAPQTSGCCSRST
jgi:hypothetical protein